MSVSNTINQAPVVTMTSVASWTQLDTNHAKISLIGDVNIYSLGGIWTQIQNNQQTWLNQFSGNELKAARLTFDASQASAMDGAAIAFLINAQEVQEKAGAQFELQGLESRYQPLLKEFQPISNLFPASVPKPKINFVVGVGLAAQNLLNDARGLITFLGHLSSDLAWSVRHIRQVRWGDFVNAAVEAGIAALPIVGLVSFLIGVIVSFQAAIGMKQFGAVSFVGPLAALGIVREMGPLITAAHLARVKEYVPDDAKVAFRGNKPTGPGYWFAPTVLEVNDVNDRTYREEIFGPVVSVITFEDEEDAIRIANDSEFGLSGSIWSRDIGRAVRVSRAVEAGNLSVNSNSSVRYWTPFGGYKQSGLGRELGPDALDAFTETKNVFFDTNS